MVRAYKGSIKTGENSNELRHFKYVHKEKKNGKWVYYYYDKNREKDNPYPIYEKTKGKKNSQYGIYKNSHTNTTIHVKKSKNLLSGRSIHRTNGSETQVRSIGRIERGYNSAKKKVKIFTKRAVKDVKKSVERGRSYVESLFKRM